MALDYVRRPATDREPVMKRLSIIAALSVGLLSANSHAQDSRWTWVGSGKGVSSFVDVGSVRRTGSVVKYWTKLESSNSPDIKRSVNLIEADCATGRTRILQATAYMKNGDNPTIPGDGIWGYAVPGTLGEGQMKLACET